MKCFNMFTYIRDISVNTWTMDNPWIGPEYIRAADAGVGIGLKNGDTQI